ncbi:hypothetical protein Sango_0637500 [Sesamum angolense]|uniref:Uncharacterized protein n=1 Tax=Sesamum angolense TaxID=2727404 RepID=A0AAE2C2I1_9LAMI|nr:hypothetical protein Sango_0637500 [Sesamum angolense]
MGEIGTSSGGGGGGGDEQNPQTSDLKQKGKLIEIATSSGGEEVHETIQQRRSDAPDAQKVPPLLLKEEKNKEDYIPKAVSIGPYHHGEAELHLAEAFKPKAVQMFVYGGERSRDFYYSNVFARIGEIRSCYEEGSTDKYSDRKLAKMMLFLNGTSVGEYDSRSRLAGGKEPFHLLEALRMGFKSRWLCCFRVDQRPLASAENGLNRSTGLDLEAGVDPAAVADPGATTDFKCRCLDCMGVCREGPEAVRRGEVERIPHSFRSVTDLKRKGIRFKPSSSRSFSDVKFESELFCSQLRLPKKLSLSTPRFSS